MLKISHKNWKELFNSKFISVRQKNDYVYLHENREGAVAVLGYRRSSDLSKRDDPYEYLGRFENCPAHNNSIDLCSLTGGIEDSSALEAAKRELQEESGIDPEGLKFESLGTAMPYKASDMKINLFAVEIKDREPSENPSGDGSKGEEGSYCKWVSREEMLNCKDPIAHTMILRLENRKG